VNNLPKVVTQRCLEQDLNPRPTDRKPKMPYSLHHRAIASVRKAIAAYLLMMTRTIMSITETITVSGVLARVFIRRQSTGSVRRLGLVRILVVRDVVVATSVGFARRHGALEVHDVPPRRSCF